MSNENPDNLPKVEPEIEPAPKVESAPKVEPEIEPAPKVESAPKVEPAPKPKSEADRLAEEFGYNSVEAHGARVREAREREAAKK